MAVWKEASVFAVGHILWTGAEGFDSGAVIPREFILRALRNSAEECPDDSSDEIRRPLPYITLVIGVETTGVEVDARTPGP